VKGYYASGKIKHEITYTATGPMALQNFIMRMEKYRNRVYGKSING
jgi:hypothetical protein